MRFFSLVFLLPFFLCPSLFSQTNLGQKPADQPVRLEDPNKPPPPPSATELNEALGAPLFPQTDSALWNESATALAAVLRWPQESKKKTTSSYRNYPNPPQSIFDCKSYCQTLLAENDAPIAVTFIFANKGDSISSSTKKDKTGSPILTPQATAEFKTAIANDARKLETTLVKLLGKPTVKYSGASAKTGEVVRRWDWKSHSFLLSAPRDEYVALRVVPTTNLDESGIERADRKKILARLAESVLRRPNGDIVITEIPMVDQGPKGYCVPATWERLLRYMGIPSDMYLLAMAGGTDQGGGTSVSAMNGGAKNLVQLHGLRTEPVPGKLSMAQIAQSVSQGIPLLWSMTATPDFLAILRSRPSASRRANSDKETLKKQALSYRQKPEKITRDPRFAHQCLITGFNMETREIAVSNSWGPSFEENWVLIEEAEKVDMGNALRIVP